MKTSGQQTSLTWCGIAFNKCQFYNCLLFVLIISASVKPHYSWSAVHPSPKSFVILDTFRGTNRVKSKCSFTSFLSVAESLIIITKSDVAGPLESSPFLLLASAHKANLQLWGPVLCFMLTTEQTVAIVGAQRGSVLPWLRTQQISKSCLCAALVWGAVAYLENPRKKQTRCQWKWVAGSNFWVVSGIKFKNHMARELLSCRAI